MFLKTHLHRLKLIFAFICSVLSTNWLFSQTIPTYNLTLNPQTSTAVEGVLYDSGGPNKNYTDNENATSSLPPNNNFYTFNIKPTTGGCIELTIDSLGTEPNFDTLNIYDGNTGELLDRLSGTSIQAITFQASTNWVKVSFRSDESTNSRGFKLSWKSIANCTTPRATLCSAAELIPSLPFRKQSTTCNDRLDGVSSSACSGDEFLQGKDHIFKFKSNGGQCIKLSLSNFLTSATVGVSGRPTGINVGVYKDCPSESSGECIATGKLNLNRDSIFINNARLELAGDYYIVISRREACTPFTIRIDTIPCLNKLPNAGYCSKALSLNDCSNALSSDIVLDLTSQGDASFISVSPPSANAGCIGGLGFVPGIDTPRYNYVFLTLKAYENGQLGFTMSSIAGDNNSDADFNVYGPIDKFEDICTYIKNTSPARSSYGVERTTPNRMTGLVDSYVNTLGNTISVNDECEDGLGDGVVRRLDVEKGKYYVIWINDYKGTIGNGGVRLSFAGTTSGVLDSMGLDATTKFTAGRDTVLFPGRSTQLNAQGGITYTWNPPTSLNNNKAFNPIATPSQTTNYTVNIQGTCREVTRAVKVEVYEVNKLPDLTVCKGEQLVFRAGKEYPNMTGISWAWKSPTAHLTELSCTNCPTPTFTATNTTGADETHTFISTLRTPQGNISDTFNIVVTKGAVPVYNVITNYKTSRDTAICAGKAISLLKAGFDNTATYTWSATTLGHTLSSNNPSVSPNLTTTFYVTVTGGAGGCTSNSLDSVIVNVYQLPSLIGIPDNNYCTGTEITMGTSPLEEATTYSWTPTEGLDKTDIPNPKLTVQSGTTQYILTATNKGGCVSKDTTNITGVDLAAFIDLDDSIRICKGSPLTLVSATNPPNLPVRWSSDRDYAVSDSSLTEMANPQRVTRYFASLSMNGCTKIDTITVYVDSLPFNTVILPKDTTVCQGTEVVFRSPAYEPILFPKISFKWTPKQTQLTSDTLYNLVVSTDTAVKRYYREMTNGVCKGIDSVNIKVNPIPTLTVIPRDTTICPESKQPVVLNASSSVPNTTDWKWTGPDGQEIPGTKDKQTIGVTPTLSENIYKVTAKVGDCPGSASATVRISAPPTVTFPADDIICLGSSVTLNSSPNNTFTYSWSSAPTGFISTQPAPSASPSVTTTYTVNITNALGCKNTQSKEFRVATGSLTVTPDVSLCANDVTTITATGTSNIGGAYKWTTGQTTATITPTVTTTTNYTVTFTYGNNCSIAKTVKATAVPGFTVRILPDSITSKLIDQGTSLALSSILIGNFSSPTFAWKDNGKDIGSTQNVNVVATDPTHTYNVNVTSTTGCKASATAVMNVRFPNYEMPNAFSPNGDNVNATFNIEFDPENKSGTFNSGNPKPRFWKGNIQVESFTVFNRWGVKVFEETSTARLNDKTFLGWDGKKDNTELPSDVYIYLIKLKMPDGTLKNLSGEVNLIR